MIHYYFQAKSGYTDELTKRVAAPQYFSSLWVQKRLTEAKKGFKIEVGS